VLFVLVGHIVNGEEVVDGFIVVVSLLLANVILALMLIFSDVSSILIWYSFSIISAFVSSVVSVFSGLLDFGKLAIVF
jgi:hypothetical protein